MCVQMVSVRPKLDTNLALHSIAEVLPNKALVTSALRLSKELESAYSDVITKVHLLSKVYCPVLI
jgi:hypothetical protein